MSTVPAVVTALVALAEATFSVDDWQVIDGPPAAETIATQRLISIAGDEITGPTDLAVLSATRMHDRYRVPFLVSVSLPGPDALPTARTLALGAYESLRDAVLAAQNLGLGAQGVLQALPTGEVSIQQFATSEVRSVAVRSGVDVIAQDI